jgi:pyruvate-formate lyase-activating enzyme
VIDLPWTAETGPHLVLEITQACNIACRSCYKIKSEQVKPREQVLAEVDFALRKRQIQTVSIGGAEPTLHPELGEIVREIRRRGLRAALVTNGLLLDDDYLDRLKRAGLDVVMFHVDEGQRRPDLPSEPSVGETNRLRTELTRRAARHGLDAGLSVTLYPEVLSRLADLVRLVVESDPIHFLFATHSTDVHGLMRGASRRRDGDGHGNEKVTRMLREELGMEPFASIGGQSWISYFVPVLYGGERPEVVRLRSGAADALLMHLPRLLSGRHMFYCPPRSFAVAAQLAVNRIARGELRQCASLFRRILRDGLRLDAKRMVFDNGPVADARGAVGCFEFCPNPTVKNGKLVPVCVSDYQNA